jgi:hypothetical protein
LLFDISVEELFLNGKPKVDLNLQASCIATPVKGKIRTLSDRESRPACAWLKVPLPNPNYGTPLPRQPKIKKITHITRNTKNKSFAIPAEAAAMPPNPNSAAINAIIRKVIAQPNIVPPPLGKNRIS